MKRIQPILVLGSPRAGNTLIGNYLGTHPNILYLGEYYSLFFATAVAPRPFARVPSIYKGDYLKALERHAVWFAAETTRQNCRDYYCDSTPWNLLIARELQTILPNAWYVLCVRDYRGVIQSLKRSYERGYAWAGRTLLERASLWASFYVNARFLPPTRTLIVNYDDLCASPHSTIEKLNKQMHQRIGMSAGDFSLRPFTQRHATRKGDRRRTIGLVRQRRVVLTGIPSFDESSWNSAYERTLAPIVKPAIEILRGLAQNKC